MRQIQWSLFGKGMIVGATMIVPGVSGGTMAIILGIYDQLITAAGSVLQKQKSSLAFLTTFSLGAVLGLFLFSSPLAWLLENFRVPTIYFFIGAVAGGIPFLGKKSNVEHVGIDVIAYLLAGAGLVLLMDSFSGGFWLLDEMKLSGNFVCLLLAGIISSVALILPGISFSHFLLVLGLYKELLDAVRTMNLGFLLPLAFGVLAGSLAFSKALGILMERYPKQTYLMILGFVIGSLAKIFPEVSSVGEMLMALPATVLGFFLVFSKTGMQERRD